MTPAAAAPQSLSADNLFVMFLIFQRFKVPMRYRGRVLTWGIASAAVLRMAMVGAPFLGFELNFKPLNPN